MTAPSLPTCVYRDGRGREIVPAAVRRAESPTSASLTPEQWWQAAALAVAFLGLLWALCVALFSAGPA